MKGVAEFYRNYPNLKKESDGKYHLYHVNSNESIWGGRDPDEEISSMMGLLPATIRASEILGVDADMRPLWRELLSNLAPLPTSNHPDAQPAGAGKPPVLDSRLAADCAREWGRPARWKHDADLVLRPLHSREPGPCDEGLVGCDL